MQAQICPILRDAAQMIYDDKVSFIPNIENRPIIVISDIHGAYNELLAIMQANGMVDAAEDIGKKHIIVIMGDLIHRGPESRKCV